MKLIFAERGWQDYLYWQQQDRKTLRRLDELIRDTTRTPLTGLGKPEPLKGDPDDWWGGWWSRRITQERRLVYQPTPDAILIAQCRFHY